MSASIDPQKLLDLIAHKSAERGVATMPELHEACGLDVESMYETLMLLVDAKRISIQGEYPFEQVRLLTPSPKDVRL